MLRQPKYKICRRLGSGVHEKCQSQKFAVSEARRSKTPGGRKRPRAMTEYGNQFLEKQRIRFSYGITERQLSNYVKEASQKKAPAETLYEKLENRLDNVIYRMGLANTRALARQMVSHGHIMVNKKKLNIPSYQVRVGDEISVRPGSQGKVLFQNLDKKLQNYIIPEWLKFDTGSALGKVLGKPKNQESFLDFSTALEFYSR